MEPHVPNEVTFQPNDEGVLIPDVSSVTLVKGQRIAIEPMLSTNRGDTRVEKNGWTIKLHGGGLAAHFERTVTVVG